mgnify:CR=1 FL=1
MSLTLPPQQEILNLPATRANRSKSVSLSLAFIMNRPRSKSSATEAPGKPVAKGAFRPISHDQGQRFNDIFGCTKQQQQTRALRPKDEQGHSLYDEIGELLAVVQRVARAHNQSLTERDEIRHLLSHNGSPARSRRESVAMERRRSSLGVVQFKQLALCGDEPCSPVMHSLDTDESCPMSPMVVIDETCMNDWGSKPADFPVTARSRGSSISEFISIADVSSNNIIRSARRSSASGPLCRRSRPRPRRSNSEAARIARIADFLPQEIIERAQEAQEKEMSAKAEAAAAERIAMPRVLPLSTPNKKRADRNRPEPLSLESSFHAFSNDPTAYQEEVISAAPRAPTQHAEYACLKPKRAALIAKSRVLTMAPCSPTPLLAFPDDYKQPRKESQVSGICLDDPPITPFTADSPPQLDNASSAPLQRGTSSEMDRISAHYYDCTRDDADINAFQLDGQLSDDDEDPEMEYDIHEGFMALPSTAKQFTPSTGGSGSSDASIRKAEATLGMSLSDKSIVISSMQLDRRDAGQSRSAASVITGSKAFKKLLRKNKSQSRES